MPTAVSLVEPRPDPSTFALGYDEEAVDKTVDGLHAHLVALEADFAEPILSPADALTRVAELHAEEIQSLIILADTQDNPGGGG
ncbi:hypothetical protein F503_03104 [Ophiostoma piceae UAMH 11346]|uniref:Uncharacterized protein n=1 Tax=Ophiostoma piceae (strain UAMH 11346) TaxID=1262450 RepID=S3C1S4_OPHP1|nr:hypothetical protein F503_03104 [Ophiostoma piceae UAMH 11346]